MKQILKFILITLCVFIIGCKLDKEEKTESTDEAIERVKPKTSNEVVTEEKIEKEKYFFTKHELDFIDTKDMFISDRNEIILFRPTEFKFGKMVEDNQSDELVNLDGSFEELTNTIINTFKSNDSLKVSICETPYIAIPQQTDTLFLDANKHLYGIIINKKEERPLFRKASTISNEIIKEIHHIYNIN